MTSRCEAQSDVEAYSVGVAALLVTLAAVPDEDDYYSTSAYCADCATFFARWTAAWQGLGNSVSLPYNIRVCHNRVVNTSNELSKAFRNEDSITAALAMVALTVNVASLTSEIANY